jgi:hypothetical protein
MLDETHQNPDPLLNASYASLDSRAVTDEAKALIEQLTALVEDQERGGKRKNKRVSARTKLKRAVEGFLGDLLRSAASEKSKGWVYHAVRPSAFSGELVSYRIFSSLAKSLVALELIDHKPGSRCTTAARFRATARLLARAKHRDILPGNYAEHFIAALPRHPIVLRANSKRVSGMKVRGRKNALRANSAGVGAGS